MKETEAAHALDVYEEYAQTGDYKQAQVYRKSEADRYINWQRYKRCTAMAKYWCAVHYNSIDERSRNRADKRYYKYNRLAEHYKEAMEIA